MQRRSVLVDASNLRVGGGVQVAASFVDELLPAMVDDRLRARYPWLADTDVELSPVVAQNLTAAVVGGRVRVVDRGRPGPSRWRQSRREYDVEFDVFGPVYAPRRGRVRLAGFADGTSLFGMPNGVAQSLPGRLRSRLRARVSRRFYRGVDHVVVEHEFVRRSLHERWGLDLARIHVVPNTVNQVFRDRDAWAPVPRADPDGRPEVCYVTRAYPHKNLELLGAVGEVLAAEYGVEVRFLLTLTDAEWGDLSPRLRRFAVNLGPLRIDQVPTVYAMADAAVFPSLLESFSVTPLEALAAGCPLAASDRPFVRDVVGDGAHYFDPLDPADAARALAELLGSPELRRDLVARGRALSATLPAAQDRTVSYLELLDQVLHTP